MNVKTYRAADSEQAMRMIREAHGPDAVILDCKSVVGGVELVVSWESPEAAIAAGAPASAATPVNRQNIDVAAAPQLAWSQNDELLDLKRELAAMKSMLTAQLKEHSWQALSAEQPTQRSCHRMLSAMDIEPAIAEQLQSELPSGESDTVQREMLKIMLQRRVPVAPPPAEGAICLLGPQGAGKTTTIAKLAAQRVMLSGRDNIAILSTDCGRVGAQEQLRAYGNILQVPVYSASNADEAARIYRVLQKKALVLVDTAGLSFRDSEGLAELEQLLVAMPGLRCYLTLPADSESYVQSEIIDAYARFSPAGAVISRIDEAMRLGGLISNLIQHRLPAVWCTNGPRVPQNLCGADAGKLVTMAMRMAREFSVAPRTAAPRSASSYIA